MKNITLGFIGGGRITKIFLQAFRNEDQVFKSIFVFDTNPDVSVALKQDFPEITIVDSPAGVSPVNIVFLALHPPVIMETLLKIKDEIPEDTALISLAPKITIEKIKSVLNTKNIARLIPNATSYINKGFNLVCYGNNFKEENKYTVSTILNLLGQTFEVAEQKLEGYAIISAMLPTYFWFQWKELTEIGKLTGLDESESAEAVSQTLKAAISLMFESGLAYEKMTDLIPVKPIAEHELEIKNILHTKLIGLFGKIKP